MGEESVSLRWSAQFEASSPHLQSSAALSGDKITLPPSALEQLLSAATVTVTSSDSSQSRTSNFDPYNPYSYAAERQARAQFRDHHQQLPHPLTFRLVNPSNDRIVYAGIREFSADEGQIGLSPFLHQALGLPSPDSHLNREFDDQATTPENGVSDAIDGVSQPEKTLRITVHAKQLPKGIYVRLRPLEAGYDVEDWKSLLEQHLRSNFTTLTHGEVLIVPKSRYGGSAGEDYKFLIDGFKPEGDGVCIVDTDLEVDIEALNEEQARETLQRQFAKAQRAPGSKEGSSPGGKLELWQGQQGQVRNGEYVDYAVPSWARSQGIEIELSGVDEDEDLDVFVSPLAPRQQAKPRIDEHVFADFTSTYPKRIRIRPTNVELEDAESILVSVHAYKADQSSESSDTSSDGPKQFYLRATAFDPATTDGAAVSNSLSSEPEEPPNPDEVRCKNCRQWVPSRTMVLHESFCYRNNILCPKCNNVFKKSSPEWKTHWHCPHDTFFGNTAASKAKHDTVFHEPRTCSSCGFEAPSLPALSHHRTTTCPGKLIICQFCHLLVPQEGDPITPNPEALLSGLTPHELADGARTTECHLCNKIVRLRDMTTHLKHHDLERLSRPSPRICRNVNCGRTLDGVGKNGDIGAASRMGQGPGNDIGLCSICFGPLYVAIYDPEGKALKRRVERRYLTQLLSGCGKNWCQNEFCKLGRSRIGLLKPGEAVTTKDALPLVKPFVDAYTNAASPLHFCVDEASQKRRALAEMLAAEDGGITGNGGYDLPWCVAAAEAEGGDLDRARGWLKNWASTRKEAAK